MRRPIKALLCIRISFALIGVSDETGGTSAAEHFRLRAFGTIGVRAHQLNVNTRMQHIDKATADSIVQVKTYIFIVSVNIARN